MVVFGDGTQSRDFTFVSDTAHGILLAGEHPLAVGETINVGSGQEVTINELARLVAFEVGRPDAAVVHDRPRPGDVARLVADVSRAKALLGYEPRVPLSEGLKKLLHWYSELPLTPEQLLEREILHNWVSASGVA
jgi:UDP-glucose 4-epimerase